MMIKKIMVCVNKRISRRPSCGDDGGESWARLLEQRLAENNSTIPVERMYCLGQCHEGPNIRIAPNGKIFHHVQESDIDAIVAEALQ